MKHKKGSLFRTFSQHKQLIVVAVVVAGFFATLCYKHSAYATSERGKSAATILVPTAGGGLVAGLAGGAQWAPVGLGAGLVFGLGVNAIRKHREQRRAEGAPYPRQSRSNRRGRAHIKNMNNEPMMQVEEQRYTPLDQRNRNIPY